MLLRILAPLLILAAPVTPGAQQLPTVVVPAEAGVAIAARGQAQPRLAPRPAARRPAGASRSVRPASAFEAESAADPLTAAGPAALPLLGAAALAAVFGGGGSGSGTGAVATTRTR
jgi:hypothetical protein